MNQKRKVLIIDDHPIVREGLARLVNSQDDLEVCDEAGNAEQALAAIEESQPEALIVDLSLEGMSGMDLIKHLHSSRVEIPVLVVSMHDETLYAERVLRAGAKGYVMKQEATGKVLDAIRRILQGEVYVSEKVANRMVQGYVSGSPGNSVSPMERLSDRELEVFEWIGRGLTTRQIAEKLCRSVKTVDTYRARIKEKLGFQDGTELVHHAIAYISHEVPAR